MADIHIDSQGGGKLLSETEKWFVKHFIKRNTDEEVKQYFRNILKKKDLIIFGGGQIADFKYTDCCRRMYDIVCIAEEYHIPIAYHAIGFAGDDYKCSNAHFFIKSINSKATIDVSVREKFAFVSDKLIIREGIPISKVADTAVWASECYGIVKSTKTNIIGINVIKADLINEYNNLSEANIDIVDIYCSLYQRLNDLGYTVKFFINGVDRDLGTINIIKKRLRLDDNSVASFSLGNGKSFLNMLSQFDFVISSRLHTSICCYSLKIPTIAFAWDDKFKDFYIDIGSNDNCIEKFDDITMIFNKCKSAIKDEFESKRYDLYRQTVRKHLDDLMNRITHEF